jgi:hypothetical protein
MPRYRVAVVPLVTPGGDVNAPEHAILFTKLLQQQATERGVLVSMPDPFADCLEDIVPCAAAAAKRVRADAVIYGTLVHSTEGGNATIQLEAVVMPSAAVRAWDDSVTDDEIWYKGAARDAYRALLAPGGP